MAELFWLCKIFAIVIFFNSNLIIDKQKNDIDELPDDSTDLFQRNMLHRYLDLPSENFKNGAYKVINKLCFAEF